MIVKFVHPASGTERRRTGGKSPQSHGKAPEVAARTRDAEPDPVLSAAAPKAAPTEAGGNAFGPPGMTRKVSIRSCRLRQAHPSAPPVLAAGIGNLLPQAGNVAECAAPTSRQDALGGSG